MVHLLLFMLVVFHRWGIISAGEETGINISKRKDRDLEFRWVVPWNQLTLASGSILIFLSPFLLYIHSIFWSTLRGNGSKQHVIGVICMPEQVCEKTWCVCVCFTSVHKLECLHVVSDTQDFLNVFCSYTYQYIKVMHLKLLFLLKKVLDKSNFNSFYRPTSQINKLTQRTRISDMWRKILDEFCYRWSQAG